MLAPTEEGCKAYGITQATTLRWERHLDLRRELPRTRNALVIGGSTTRGERQISHDQLDYDYRMCYDER